MFKINYIRRRNTSFFSGENRLTVQFRPPYCAHRFKSLCVFFSLALTVLKTARFFGEKRKPLHALKRGALNGPQEGLLFSQIGGDSKVSVPFCCCAYSIAPLLAVLRFSCCVCVARAKFEPLYCCDFSISATSATCSLCLCVFCV